MKNFLNITRAIPNLMRDICLNVFRSQKYDLFYVIENAEWSIAWDGRYIVENLNRGKLLKSAVIYDTIGIRNRIVHFGSENTFIYRHGIIRVHRSNKVIMTWFHITPGDERIRFIPLLNNKTDLVHTSSAITKQKLVEYGLKEEKIRVVPLGVDCGLFRPPHKSEKDKIRASLSIPSDSVVVGSFQKDGVGWGEGNEPKLVKGPDIFCQAIKEVARSMKIFVLLTGPARGYVKKQLQEAKIPFLHSYITDYKDIARFYRALDLYLVTSREEGGPKAILEAMASGVPIISTEVGMAPEVIVEGVNGMLSPVGDSRAIGEKASILLGDRLKLASFIEKGLITAKEYDWSIIARRYYKEIYADLISKKLP